MIRCSVTQILKNSPAFSGLNENELNELSKIAVERVLVPSEVLYFENDLPPYFYILAEGRIKSFVTSSLGKEFILAFLGPGEILGPVSILRDKPTTGTMQSVTRTRVLRFRKHEFESFLLNHPQVSLEIIKILSGRIAEFSWRLRDLAGEKVKQRIARILYMLSSRLGSDLPFTRQEIAEMVGTTTETAIRTMCHLKHLGIIDSFRSKIILLDSAKLRQFIEDET